MNKNEDNTSDTPTDIALGIAAGVALVATFAMGYNALMNKIDGLEGDEKKNIFRLAMDFRTR